MSNLHCKLHSCDSVDTALAYGVWAHADVLFRFVHVRELCCAAMHLNPNTESHFSTLLLHLTVRSNENTSAYALTLPCCANAWHTNLQIICLFHLLTILQRLHYIQNKWLGMMNYLLAVMKNQAQVCIVSQISNSVQEPFKDLLAQVETAINWLNSWPWKTEQ